MQTSILSQKGTCNPRPQPNLPVGQTLFSRWLDSFGAYCETKEGGSDVELCRLHWLVANPIDITGSSMVKGTGWTRADNKETAGRRTSCQGLSLKKWVGLSCVEEKGERFIQTASTVSMAQFEPEGRLGLVSKLLKWVLQSVLCGRT